MGELHLEIKQQLLRDDFGLEVRAGSPQVAYREAPTRSARAQVHVDRAIGEEQLRGGLGLEVLPLGDGLARDAFGLEIEWEAGDSISRELRAAICERLGQEARLGPRYGFPLGRLLLRVLSCSDPAEEPTELGLLQAASQALREALLACGVQVYEPLMSFEVEAPMEFMSSAIGRLNANGAQIRELSAEGRLRQVRGTVALATMFGFASVLRSLSQGRASFSMLPAGFQPLDEPRLRERGLS